MRSFLIVLFLINLVSPSDYQESCDCHNPIKNDFNNTDVPRDNFKSLASIFVKFNSTNKASICTSIVINENWSITNSDCCRIIDNLKERNYNDLKFYVGAGNHNLDDIYDNDLNYKEINQIILHPENANLCLIELNQPFQLDSETNIFKSCLQNIEINKFTDDFLFSGYKIDNSVLINKSEEDKLLANKNSKLKLTNLKSINCDKKELKCLIDLSLCDYENGGGIFYVFNGIQYLIGITSQTIDECNDKIEFELIYPNLNWIKMNVKNDICSIDLNKSNKNSSNNYKNKKQSKSELLRKTMMAFGILVVISFTLINGFFAFKFLD